METMCRVCFKLKPRIKAEGINKRKGHYYRDANGKRWHGFRCPECHVKATKSRYYGEKQKELRPVKTNRKCRVCNEALPADRYFKHRACDSAYFAYTSNGHSETIWTPEDWGMGYCQFGSGF